MARRMKLKLRMCCGTSKGIYFAVPNSKSIQKLRSRYVKQTGGMSLDAPICHAPVGVDSGMQPICVDYRNGDWRAKPW